MTREFEGKVALVTGSGSGIGRATAIAFADRGAKVVVSDIDTNGGNETVRMIKKAGGESTFFSADVANEKDIEALVGNIIEKYGSLDCGVNNAGITGYWGLLGDMTEESWNEVISINLKGVFLCMKYEIQQMLKQGGGAIVNIASIAGIVAQSFAIPYSASKHGVNGITKAAALGYARENIRINSVCPGVIKTPLVTELFESSQGMFEKYAVKSTPMGRLGRPEEIAAAVIWLCSDAASFVTGHAMVVDGGFTAQ